MAASPKRKPGSDLGRAAIDWEHAFAFYATLTDQKRSYQAVADEYKVSLRTVEKHGRNGRWGERLRAIKTKAADETNVLLGQARVEQIGKTIRLIDASMIGYADKLRRGEVRMIPADLERLHRLHQQLGEQLELATKPADQQPQAAAARSPEHTAAVIAALRDSGALEALGLQAIPPAPPGTSDEQHDTNEESR